jgi:HSP20 family protein
VGERLFVPEFEVRETPDAYLIKADLPGVRDEDLDVSVTGNRVTVSGRRDEEQRRENDTIYVYERAYGNFSRTFTLPEGAASDEIKADIDKGVLTLSIPKKPEVQPKKIKVGSQKPGAPVKA